MKILFGISLTLFVLWAGVRVYNAILFDKDCGGYLKRAADANTVELAKAELNKALTYMEQHNMTEGYTSIIYRTPDEDIGFWYTNLKNSHQELMELDPDSPPLERSNMLMKLRETILDEGESIQVTNPSGISMFPHNGVVAVWGLFSFLMMGFSGIVLFLRA